MRKIAFTALAVLGSFSAACSGTPDAAEPIDADSSELSVASDAYAIPTLTSVSLGASARTVGNVTVQDARNSGGAPITLSSAWSSAIRNATAAGVAPGLAPNVERLVTSPGATASGALGAANGLWSDAPVSGSVGFRGNRPTVASWKSATVEESAGQQDRGGRLACAFREAASKMNGARVAQAPWSAARLDFFGYPVEVMQVAPTLALRKASVDHGASGDGAEGHALPMDVGVRVTPLTNLGLPSLAEAVAPITVFAADSMSIATRTARSATALPTIERSYYSGYAEAVRANAVERTVSSEPLTLFTVSGIEARARFSATQYAGVLVDPAASAPGALQAATQLAVFGTQPRPGRIGWLAGGFDDAALRAPCLPSLLGNCPQPTALRPSMPLTGESLSASPGALLSRVLQNDDLNATVQSGARVDAALEVNGGLSFPYVQVTVGASGGLFAKAFVDHVVSRGARVQQLPGNSLGAQTGVVDQLVVRPRFGANLGLAKTYLEFTFRMNLPFVGPIDWAVPVPVAGEKSLAEWTTDASPATRRPDSGSLRLGVGSSASIASTREPIVWSQVPNAAPAATFSSLPLASCLGSDPAPVPTPPAPTGATKTPGAAPSLELCAVSTFERPAMMVRATTWGPLGATECRDARLPSGMSALSSAGAACRAAWRDLLCSGRTVIAPAEDPATPTGGARWGAGEYVQSRVVRTASAADQDAIGRVMLECGRYAGELPQAERAAFMRRVTQFAVCDANAVPRTMSIAATN